MNKSPAFQFYPDDWLSCEKVSVMTPECEGAYIRLLAYAWKTDDCGLPTDPAKLAILSRMAERWQCDGIKMVLPCFFEKDGRLYNKRLLQEREKQKIYRLKQSENAKHRYNKDLTGVPPHCQASAKNMPPSSSPSSSPSKEIRYVGDSVRVTEITGYEDINNPENKAIDLTLSVTGDNPKSAGFFSKALKELGDKKYREILGLFWSELQHQETVRNKGAAFTAKLKRFMKN